MDENELRDRLQKAEARRLEAERKREDLADSRSLEQQVTDAEIAAADAEAMADAEEKHGAHKVKSIGTALGCVIVKAPNPLIFRRFQDRGEHKTSDMEALVRKCLVYPTATALDRIIEEEPATIARAANCVVELAGFRESEVSKKS